jgi:hypothetical protein
MKDMIERERERELDEAVKDSTEEEPWRLPMQQ